MNVWIIRIFLS